MDITIGMRNVGRELSLKTTLSAEEASATVEKALAGPVLKLTDERGRQVLVPTSVLAYVEISPEDTRRVGFVG